MKISPSITLNKDRVHVKEKMAYGLGNFSANLLLTTANTYMVYYYTDVVGIAAGIVGTLLLVAKILDACFDLSVGAFLDHQKTTKEKARPWIKRMAIPFGIVLILMYSVPNGTASFKTLYAFITYILAMFIFSAISVPYNSMVSLASTNAKDRSQLSSYRNMMGSVGGWLLTVITLPMVAFFGSGRHGWLLVAVVYGVLSAICYFVSYANTHERVRASVKVKDEGTLLQKIKTVSHNRYWWIVLFIMILTFISAGISGVNVYFAKYIMGNSDFVGILGTANYIPMILGSIALIPLTAMFSKRAIVLGGVLLGTIGCFIIVAAPTSELWIIIGSVLKGFGSSAVYGLVYAMFGDTVDYGEWKFGKRAEGLTFSAGSFSEKVGSGLGVVILGFLLNIGGYVGGKTVQTALALHMINFSFIWVPILINVASIVLLLFYNLDKNFDAIRKELDEKVAANNE